VRNPAPEDEDRHTPDAGRTPFGRSAPAWGDNDRRFNGSTRSERLLDHPGAFFNLEGQRIVSPSARPDLTRPTTRWSSRVSGSPPPVEYRSLPGTPGRSRALTRLRPG